MLEVEIASFPSLAQAIQACSLQLAAHGESVAVSIGGEQAFVHRLKLPATAAKQLDEVLPYEVEAQIPVDIAELVFDHRLIRRTSADEPIVVLAAAARRELVRERINLIRSAIGREPERVGCGPLPLANLAKLAPELVTATPTAIIDIGGKRTELVISVQGEPVFARTLSRGIEGLPATAPMLAGELRQTFGAWLAQGGVAIENAYLVGGGASAEGAEAYLAHQLGMPVRVLPSLALGALAQEAGSLLPRYAKAISLALSLRSRPVDVDLRQGDLSFQRGYGFLKEKVPVLSGLAAAIFISFLFSTWAQMKALDREEEALAGALTTLSKEALGEETSDPERALELLETAKGTDQADPMPHMDAFGVLAELSDAIPTSITHDIDEFDMQRGHVKLNGVVGSAADAQTISSELAKRTCFHDPKISKVSQMVNSDRQKYVLDFDVRCPDDQAAKKKKKKTETAAAEGAKP
jgi:general secretion pathway protein L